MQGFDIDNFHIRPRFGFAVPLQKEEVLERLQRKMDAPNAACKGKISNDHVFIDIPETEQHFWSPQMSFAVEEDEKGAYIRGLFGPKPNVWTMFVFIYTLVGVIGTFLTLYGMSKWALGEFSYTIMGFPIAFIIMCSAYIASKMGEKLGHDQVDVLKRFFKDALKNV